MGTSAHYFPQLLVSVAASLIIAVGGCQSQREDCIVVVGRAALSRHFDYAINGTSTIQLDAALHCYSMLEGSVFAFGVVLVGIGPQDQEAVQQLPVINGETVSASSIGNFTFSWGEYELLRMLLGSCQSGGC